MDKPYFSELSDIPVGNVLYKSWVDHLMGLSKDDMVDMAKAGLTYQVEAIEKMINEIVAGGTIPPSLKKKIKAIVNVTKSQASKMR